ncbi:hypothetical protein GCM10009823_26180 [Brevibacterium salitolerans]|uniref:Tetracycline repressor TetR C-terminal domain-containing protein n=3 Tax=Brevibacterium TaxID=1696 RepID=A0ABN2X3V8_9MICO
MHSDASTIGHTMRTHHKPLPMADLDHLDERPDPARLAEIAHATASLLVYGTVEGRPTAAGEASRAGRDTEATARFVRLADEIGLEVIAEIWASAPAVSLPGVLWRLYALREWITTRSARVAEEFDAGRTRGRFRSETYLTELLAGVENPPGPDEVVRAADEILAGAFRGDFSVALLRAAAFTEVCAAGRRALARDALALGSGMERGPDDLGEGEDPEDEPVSRGGRPGGRGEGSARAFEELASDLVHASRAHRAGTL